jgi:RNA polymerase sigma-70 factor (ECF subfamily)
LEEAIHALPFKMRSAVALYYVNDYSTRETAKIMGVAEGTVKAHLHAARRKLRRFLS